MAFNSLRIKGVMLIHMSEGKFTEFIACLNDGGVSSRRYAPLRSFVFASEISSNKMGPNSFFTKNMRKGNRSKNAEIVCRGSVGITFWKVVSRKLITGQRYLSISMPISAGGCRIRKESSMSSERNEARLRRGLG